MNILRFIIILIPLLGTACGMTGGVLPRDAVLLSDVPFIQQDDFQCGPSALAMVINYWDIKMGTGRNISLEKIIEDIYSPTARGVLGLDLEIYARKMGFATQRYAGSIDDVKRRINEGIPLILLVDYGISSYQRNHFLVTTGYIKGAIIVNSGRRKHEIIHEEKFKRIWKKTDFWTLLIRPSPL